MTEAGQAHVARAGNLRRHALHHRRGRVAVELAGQDEHRHCDVREVGALVEGDEAAHRCAVGGGRHRAHAVDGERAPGRIGRAGP